MAKITSNSNEPADTGADVDSRRGTFSEQLADQLREAIASGGFPVGTSLPSERELMARYEVSRATVREALRMLSGQDLIEVRRGRSGGSFVSQPGPSMLVRSLNQFITGHNFRYIDLIAAREAIEPAAAAQAAMRATDEQLAALRECSQRCEDTIEDAQAFIEANLDWHLALARASGNLLFVAFLTSISTAMHKATEFEEFDVEVRRAVTAVHWQIYQGIAAGDPSAARRRTLRHLKAYEETLAEIT